MTVRLATYRLPRLTYSTPENHDYQKEANHYVHYSGTDEYDPIMANVHERVKNHSRVMRKHYGKRDGLMPLIKMEYDELIADHADGDAYEIEKELYDLAVACICAISEMKSM